MTEEKAKYKLVPFSLSDTGWIFDEKTSIKSIGIYDYKRTVSFDHKLSTSELVETEHWLKINECPGWTGITSRIDENFTYMFRTTYDSSD